MALDYASILSAGRSLVPDMRVQAMQDAQFRWAQEEHAAEQESRAKARAYGVDLEAALTDGSPAAILNLMARYPQMREAIKPVYDAMDARQRQRDLTQLGSIYSNAQNGNVERAAAILEQRIAADGPDADPQDRAVLDGLRSNDPTQRSSAIATIGILLAASTGDDFANTYGKLNPTEAKTTRQREYEWRVGQFGKPAADQWLATQDTELVPVQAGGSVYNKADFAQPIPQATEGGDPASDWTGGVPAPQVGDNGVPATLTPDQYRVVVQQKGKAATDAWMQRNGITVGAAPAGPVRVRSVQEAQRLAPGTQYITPDGKVFQR